MAAVSIENSTAKRPAQQPKDFPSFSVLIHRGSGLILGLFWQAPAGLIEIEAACSNGKAREITLKNQVFDHTKFIIFNANPV